MKTLLLCLASLLILLGCSSCTAVPTPYGYAVMFGGKGAMKSNMTGNPTIIHPQ